MIHSCEADIIAHLKWVARAAHFCFLKTNLISYELHKTMSIQHFLTLSDLPYEDIRAIVARASELKKNPSKAASLSRKTLGLVFEKSSTRTRVAFEVAMTQMGGSSLFLRNSDSQLGRGEPVEDTSRVLSRIVDCLAVRTDKHSKLENFAQYSQVPVVNALSDKFHPCQLLADVQTYNEKKGSISGRSVAWVGDGNNVCQSYINASKVFDFELRIGCPKGFEPDKDLLSGSSARVTLVDDPVSAVIGADLVVTDVWASMGQESEHEKRARAFKGFQVTSELMSYANKGAIFMHCLPAHRGEEVSPDVIDAVDSIVWDEAENRMHSQKALLEFLLS